MLEEDEEANENSSPFLNTPIPDSALHAAKILKELGYENIAIYPGGTSMNLFQLRILILIRWIANSLNWFIHVYWQ